MLRPVTLLLAVLFCTCARAQKGDTLPDIATKTAAMELHEGFYDFYHSEKEGKIYVVVPTDIDDFLYVNSLAAGLGSNDIGLDRNQLGNTRVVHFQRVGPKMLLKERNLDYRAMSDNPDEARSVEDAFAQSVLHGFKVVAEDNDRALIDLTPLLLTDAHGVAARLKARKQGTYKVSEERSAIHPENIKNFPNNSEFEAIITLTGEPTAPEVRSVAPTPESFTLRMRHSFVELSDDDYEPRPFDPRSGYYARSYADYATPIAQPLVKRYITRHRLKKKDPTVAVSEAVEPIVYYLDRGAPEPVRSALLEGARWWNEAFEAAGYKDAFRVEILPEDADPLDVRYNVINWVHRSTRGWSYGSSVTDPRTGEIIKGHVLLGSLRVRQDFLIAQGLIAAYGADGTTPDPRLEELALARLRQLSAHEVGHTLGLAHNFAASTNDRASVMDYPHPYVTLNDDNSMDFSQAYATGIGEWDKRTILYGYQDFGEGAAAGAMLDEILVENEQMGLRYISDADARPQGSSQPQGHLWDNGSDPLAELERLLQVRQQALKNFGVENIPLGTPLSELEKVLVPVYLMHRYQVEAVAKVIGGYEYDYGVRVAGEQPKYQPVALDRQQAATEALMRTLLPGVLAMPARIHAMIPPPAMGYGRDRESFKTYAGAGLDPLAMAEAAADVSLDLLLHPHRLARITEQRVLYRPVERSLEDYLDEMRRQLRRNIRDHRNSDLMPYEGTLPYIVERRFVEHLIGLMADESVRGDVRAQVYGQLNWYANTLGNGGQTTAHDRYLNQRVLTFLRNPEMFEVDPAPKLPDGSPIGCGH